MTILVAPFAIPFFTIADLIAHRRPEAKTQVVISRSNDAIAPFVAKLLTARAEHVYIDKEEFTPNENSFTFCLSLTDHEVVELITRIVPAKYHHMIQVDEALLKPANRSEREANG